MPTEPIEARVSAIRHFNRFFTRQIGVLREGLLHSPYSLAEGRIIQALAQRQGLTAADLGREFGLDAGYLSRLLTKLEQQGLLEKVRSETDGRQSLLHLTPEGEQAYALLDQRARDEIIELLSDLSEDEQQRLLKAMETIEGVFSKGLKYAEPFVLRQHEPGDMGWVVHRQSILYAQEYGWDEHYEALVAQIVSDFIKHYNPDRERCWIAEMNGEVVGSVFCVQASETVAKLRLLYVEPRARGLGLGNRLVEECIRFARRRGYQKMTLWTQSILLAARHIYEKAGFTLVAQEPHHSFGHDLIAETWDLTL
jgi:DNA-binding MarR family transcriptional regulator/N-acetylglutamate synthase-like GNAT family acetyltransferase